MMARREDPEACQHRITIADVEAMHERGSAWAGSCADCGAPLRVEQGRVITVERQERTLLDEARRSGFTFDGEDLCGQCCARHLPHVFRSRWIESCHPDADPEEFVDGYRESLRGLVDPEQLPVPLRHEPDDDALFCGHCGDQL